MRPNTSDKLDDETFSGRASPALMSPKEPAIRALKERYGESFALTRGSGCRVHLFVIKIGLWSLAYTFVFKEADGNDLMGKALNTILEAMRERESGLGLKLDIGIKGAITRIQNRASQFISQN